MSFNRHFNAEEVARLRKLIDEGCQVQGEIDTLKEGLRDTIKNTSADMDIPVAVINKAIRTAHKCGFTDERNKFETLESILEAVGRAI